MDKIVGIGEYAISNNEDTLKTFALASCVAVTAYNPSKRVAGMIHIALPSPSDEEEGRRRPGYYAASGIPLLLNKMRLEYGCKIEELELKIYGGALSIRKDNYFNIGRKNIAMIRNILLNMKLKIGDAQIGGTVSRSLEMNVINGRIKMTTHPINI